MSLSVETVLTVASLVKKAVDIYHKVKDIPEQMKKLGRRMEKLNVYLSELEEFVKVRASNSFARLLDGQRKHLGSLLEDVREVAVKVTDLFHKWENDIGPGGFQFRFKTLTAAYYALGSSQEKIAGLIEEINENREEIRDYLHLLGVKAAFAIGAGTKQPGALVPGKPATGNRTKKSPSPSPAPPRRDYKILFVDPRNNGRSMAAEALMKLMKEVTVKANADWRINWIHSAGFFVKAKGDCAELIEGLDYSYKSFRLPMIDGGIKALPVAMDAVFDNKTFPYDFKKKVQDEMTARTSRGLKKSIFKDYDYIIVFTNREHDNLLKLRMAIRQKDGKSSTPPGKGRVLHLGSLLTLDGIPREIVDAPKNKDGTVSRSNWNWKVSQIKIALKAFLKSEMNWKQPDLKVEAAN